MSVDNISAQASFTDVKDTFDTHGITNTLTHVHQIADAAVTRVIAQVFLGDDETIDPLTGNGGTNVLADRLNRELVTGDFGLDIEDEARLFERMRDRENRVLQSAVDGATRLFSSGGFSQPTGAMAAAVGRVQSEYRDKVVSASREIATKKMDMYLEAKKITYSTATAFSDSFIKVLTIRLEQFKAQLQANASVATAALAALNVNLGLSVGASASVGGSESLSETHDRDVNVTRRSDTHHWDETKGVETHSHSESIIEQTNITGT